MKVFLYKYTKSDWALVTKGLPHGSILGPATFNIFLNWSFIYAIDDYYLFVTIQYPGDNIIDLAHPKMSQGGFKENVERWVEIESNCFHNNHMNANVSHFQSIMLEISRM